MWPSSVLHAGISIHALHEESDPGVILKTLLDEFQSTLSMRRATSTPANIRPSTIFQSTLSMRRATCSTASVRYGARFQSTLSMRRATFSAALISLLASQFQSTLSMRRATSSTDSPRNSSTAFQSTLSMRRATFLSTVFNIRNYISIHALHEESDGHRLACGRLECISIHALHEESDGAPRPPSCTR